MDNDAILYGDEYLIYAMALMEEIESGLYGDETQEERQV
jgi:hypothetical protein